MGIVAALAALEGLVAQEVSNQVVGQAVYQVLSALLAPELSELGEASQQSFVFAGGTHAMDVGSVVEAYIKGHLTREQAIEQFQFWGQSEAHFEVLQETAGEPPPLLTLTEAWRRGIIDKAGPEVSLEQGIRESRLKNKWIPMLEALQFQLPPLGTIIEGWLRAQITEAQALDLAYKSGVDKDTATLMFKAAGRPPSPEELFTLWKRGVIPESGRGGDSLTLEQGFLETDLKDKWYEKWKALAEYRPPPRTITALQRAGAISDEQALKLYQEEGLTPELAAIYVKTAHHEKHAGTKELTKAEWVAMYVDQAITADELRKRLSTLGFTGEGADLEVQLADLKIAHALTQRAINRVGTLYVGRRIDKTQAMNSLDSLKMPAAQRDRLLAIWGLERADNLKHLTPVEIGHAVQNQWLTADQGLEIIAGQGYGPRDAWIVLNVHLKGALGHTPPTDNLPPA